MSEWDYAPIPRDVLMEEETEHTLLLFLSQCCLIEGKVIKPIEILENPIFYPAVEELINRTTVSNFMKILL